MKRYELSDYELIEKQADGVRDRGWNSPEQLEEERRLLSIARRLKAQEEEIALWVAAADALNGLTVAPEVPFADHIKAMDLWAEAHNKHKENNP